MPDDNAPLLSVGSLFAGIGGFDLGFERAGFQIRFQVEIDEYCRKVLAKHWPDVRRYGDIRTVTDLPYVDVLCGGFPCQDISNAGRREGIDGERSSLWGEMLRCIRMVRPQYVVVENVAALLGRGMGRVLGDLSASGYDAEWDCIPASAVGAPHRRDRVWIVAYPCSSRRQQDTRSPSRDEGSNERRTTEDDYKPECDGEGNRAANVAHPESSSRTLRPTSGQRLGRSASGGADVADSQERCCIFTNAHCASLGRIAESRGQRGEWAIEPDVGRVAHGIPSRVDRLKGLGNSLVPQIAEWIARRILDDCR